MRKVLLALLLSGCVGAAPGTDGAGDPPRVDGGAIDGWTISAEPYPDAGKRPCCVGDVE